MNDTIVRAVACNGKIRIVGCTTTRLCEVARQQHDLWPTSAAALGRVLTMTAMMGCMEKREDQKVTVQINGGGAIGTIMTEGWGNGHVRGFVSDPHQHLIYNDSGKLAVGLVVGTSGYLRVTRDLGLKDVFTSQVDLQSGEIGDDFAYYYTVSEQTPSAISLGVLVDPDNSVCAAGGLLIQIMPDACEEDIVMAEQVIAKLRPVSSMVLEGMNAQDLVRFCFEEVEILDEKPLQWYCNCSHERFYRSLCMLKASDILEVIEEDRGCEVVCEFCNQAYQYSEKELCSIVELQDVCGK